MNFFFSFFFHTTQVRLTGSVMFDVSSLYNNTFVGAPKRVEVVQKRKIQIGRTFVPKQPAQNVRTAPSPREPAFDKCAYLDLMSRPLDAIVFENGTFSHGFFLNSSAGQTRGRHGSSAASSQ